MRTVLAVIVKDGRVLAHATNPQHDCKREGYPTGKGYELCEGCQPKNHAEFRAADFLKENPRGAILYLFGHTYACKSCEEVCERLGIKINLPL